MFLLLSILIMAAIAILLGESLVITSTIIAKLFKIGISALLIILFVFDIFILWWIINFGILFGIL